MAAATRPQREDEPDRLVSETADGERERGSCRLIEPLDVVNHPEHWGCARAHANQVEEGRGDSTSVDWRSRFLPQERDGQSAALRRGKARRRLVVCGLEEVPKCGKRQPGLVVSGPTAEYLDRSTLRRIDCRIQQRALPDAGRPLDKNGARPRTDIRDEPLEQLELGLASYDPIGTVRRVMPPRSGQA